LISVYGAVQIRLAAVRRVRFGLGRHARNGCGQYQRSGLDIVKKKTICQGAPENFVCNKGACETRSEKLTEITHVLASGQIREHLAASVFRLGRGCAAVMQAKYIKKIPAATGHEKRRRRGPVEKAGFSRMGRMTVADPAALEQACLNDTKKYR